MFMSTARCTSLTLAVTLTPTVTLTLAVDIMYSYSHTASCSVVVEELGLQLLQRQHLLVTERRLLLSLRLLSEIWENSHFVSAKNQKRCTFLKLIQTYKYYVNYIRL